MAYQRFLTDNDYLALITEEGLGSLTRGNTERLAQAEQRAEMKIVDYLDQFYEVGSALNVGKRIKDYSSLITYPSNVYFKKDGKIWRTTKAMNACHAPTSVVYWEQTENLTLPAEQINEETKVLPYLQLKTYKPGDTVDYLGATWICRVANGWDFKNIQIPGITYWQEVTSEEWAANVHYSVGQVISYNDNFYAVISDDTTTSASSESSSSSDDETEEEVTDEVTDETEEETDAEDITTVIDWSDDPETNDAYGLIGAYNEGYDYTVDNNDYVVLDGVVYLPVLNPNADEPVENTNIVPDDPRNYNLVNYMTAIALYYLNALINPTNVPMSRENMFEEAIAWIEAAARMKLDPHIPRKLDRQNQEPMNDWAMASFETNQATALNNPWFT